jgi:signal transduction histidine kinase
VVIAPKLLLRSYAFRLALLYTALSVASVLMLLGYIYWATAGYMDRQTDETIEAEIRGLAEQYRRRGLNGLSRVLAERVARDPDGAAVYLLADSDFSPIIGNLNRWPDAPIADTGWTRFRLRDWGRDKSEEHEARARTFLLRGELHLLVGRDVRDLEATRGLILNALAWGLAITAALALGVGLLMSAGVTRRIEAINQTGREIMEGDLSRRVPTSGSGDDFDQLAANLNRMLSRIEELMTAVRQVSDNIAHDLRTPLTRLRTRLELARDHDPQQAGAAIDKAIEDAEVLLATFNALLRIARIESRSRRSAFSDVDLAHLVTDVGELYEPLAMDKGLRLRVLAKEAVTVQGDRDLLFQALANLLDNAIKYTPQGGLVTASAENRDGRVQVSVSDTGPGIPEALREQVFQRFFRADASRSTPGSGLGLSLVRAVADLHGARITLADNEPGLRINVLFDSRRGGFSSRGSANGLDSSRIIDKH